MAKVGSASPAFTELSGLEGARAGGAVQCSWSRRGGYSVVRTSPTSGRGSLATRGRNDSRFCVGHKRPNTIRLAPKLRVARDS